MREVLMTTSDPPVWHTDTEKNLKEFPVMLRHDQLLRHNFLHLQPGLEIHITHQGQALFRAGTSTLLQKHRHAVLIRGDVAHNQIVDPRWKYVRTVICVDHGRVPSSAHYGNLLAEIFKSFQCPGTK